MEEERAKLVDGAGKECQGGNCRGTLPKIKKSICYFYFVSMLNLSSNLFNWILHKVKCVLRMLTKLEESE